jgi:hypothetical protein
MPRPIYDTLRLLEGGAFLDECADKLAEAVKGVDETGKAGKLTITLDLKKSGGAIAITPKVTNKAPEALPDATLMWATVEGNLSLDNPAQRKLEFASVERKATQIADVKPTTQIAG